MSTVVAFFIGLAAIFALTLIYGWATMFYCRAKELAPYYAKIEDLKRDIATAQDTVARLNGDLNKLLAERTIAEQVIARGEQMQKWLDDNVGKVEALQAQIKIYEEKLKIVMEEYQRRQKELDDRVQEIANKTHEKVTLDANVAALNLQIGQLKTDAENYKKAALDAKAEMERLQEGVSVARAEAASLGEQIASRRGELEELKTSIAAVKEGIKEKENLAVELSGRLNALQEEITRGLSELERARVAKSGLEVELTSLREQRAELVDEIEEMKENLAEIEDRYEDVKSQLSIVEGALKKARADYDVQKTFNDGLVDERKKLEREIEKLELKKESEARRVAELEGRALSAESILAELKSKQDNGAEKWANLELPIIHDDNKRRFADLDEEAWLKEFGKNLEASGIIFSERTVKAFHTGLKCAQSTPLVVLAGISGTGKSLLPELYSAALGMNFLPVPVQPRWDSPQDLFGFYNYMEGRYKATELARLLWQFDRFNNEKARSMKQLPMNLVLLDEMNLARVEYYFSDLLSKLETRSGLDYLDPLQRRKAEIELECNASGQLDLIRRLFVSPHTLFVGTMNEDESTQTLSDKVIDRSNVLRFGRPENLDAKPDKSLFIRKYAGRSRIETEQWDSWCRTYSESTENDDAILKLKEVVDPILPTLDKIYRPYGYRVDKAMKTYVLNYPGDVRHAIADQIEMKVIPKLNGVELDADGFQDVKKAMVSAINAVGDEKLLEAFQASCPASGTFFKWRGVMR